MTEVPVDQISNLLSKTSVKSEGVTFKGKSLKLDSEKDCDELVEAIKACKSLEYLNLEGNTLGVEAAKAISKALETKSELKRALWKDMFTGRMKEEIPRALEFLGNGLTLAGAQLVELDLSDNAFGPIGVKGLAGLLSSKACYQLQELKLNNNGLGISGGKMLAEALLQCHKNSSKEGKALALKLLILGRNRLENEGATALAQVFQTLGSLESISMPQNGIYHKGIKALSSSFKKNPNLKVLDLNDNTITEKGANHIANALPHMQKLQVLNLGDCLLRTGGATVLANALAEKHKDLEELHLGYNEIKSEGGLAVAKAVTNKHKLKQLNVNGNHFGSAGRSLLKEDLEKSKRISTLGTLSDDDSCDEEDSEHNSESEEEFEKTAEQPEEEEEEEKEKDCFRVKEPTLNSSFQEKSSTKKENFDSLSHFLNDLSLKAKPSGPLKTFLDDPTLKNLLNVEEDKIYEFIKNNKDPSIDFVVDDFIPMLVKISSLSTCGNDKIMKMCATISKNLYKELFNWASDKNQLPIINNTLCVYFGLIKSEDKDFKIDWDVKSSLKAFFMATSEGIVPNATQDILTCCLEKQSHGDQCEMITIN